MTVWCIPADSNLAGSPIAARQSYSGAQNYKNATRHKLGIRRKDIEQSNDVKRGAS